MCYKIFRNLPRLQRVGFLRLLTSSIWRSTKTKIVALKITSFSVFEDYELTREANEKTGQNIFFKKSAK